MDDSGAVNLLVHISGAFSRPRPTGTSAETDRALARYCHGNLGGGSFALLTGLFVQGAQQSANEKH